MISEEFANLLALTVKSSITIKDNVVHVMLDLHWSREYAKLIHQYLMIPIAYQWIRLYAVRIVLKVIT